MLKKYNISDYLVVGGTLFFSIFAMLFLWHDFGRCDFEIFIDEARYFIEHGKLYLGGTAEYVPAGSSHKFPPLFASILVFFLDAGVEKQAMFPLFAVIQVGLYCATLLLLCQSLLENKSIRYRVAAVIFCFSFAPYYEVLLCLQLEIYLLFFLSLALFFYVRERDFWSGFFIGLAAAVKIYPVILGWRFFFKRNLSGIAGILAGLAIATAISVSLLGVGAHQDYWLRVFPQLLMEYPIRSSNISVTAIFYSLTDHLLSAQIMAKILFVAVLGYLLFSERRDMPVVRHSDDMRQRRAMDFMVDTLLIFFWLPNAWASYQLLLLPVLFFYFGRMEEGKVSLVLSAFLLILLCLSVDLMLRFRIPVFLLNGYDGIVSLIRSMISLYLLAWLLGIRYPRRSYSGSSV